MHGYINSISANGDITEREFEGVLAILGINVRFQFVVERGYSAQAVQQELRSKYEKFKNVNNDDIGEQQVGQEEGDTAAFNVDY